MERALLQKAIELKDRAATQRQALAATAKGQQTLNRWVGTVGWSLNEYFIYGVCVRACACMCVWCVGRGVHVNSRFSQSYSSWRKQKRCGGGPLRSSGGR